MLIRLIKIEGEIIVHFDLQILVVLVVSIDYFLDYSRKNLDDSSNSDCKYYHKLGFEVL